jgi:hypothetical protein
MMSTGDAVGRPPSARSTVASEVNMPRVSGWPLTTTDSFLERASSISARVRGAAPESTSSLAIAVRRSSPQYRAPSATGSHMTRRGSRPVAPAARAATAAPSLSPSIPRHGTPALRSSSAAATAASFAWSSNVNSSGDPELSPQPR